MKALPAALSLALVLAACERSSAPASIGFAGCLGEPGLELQAQAWQRALRGSLPAAGAQAQKGSLVLECHLHRQGQLEFVRLRLLGEDGSHALWSGSYGLEAAQQQAALAALAAAIAAGR